MKEKQMKVWRRSWAALAATLLLATACGGGEPAEGPVYEEDVPPPISSETVILTTTSIFGDIARNVAGDRARVDVMMPVGTDPHDYVPSAELVNSIYRANLVISGGFALEERMTDVLEIAMQEGVNLFEIGEEVLADHEAAIGGDDSHDEEAGGDDHDHEGDADHDEEAGEDSHDHEGEAEGDHDEDADHDEEAGEDSHDHEGEAEGDHDHDEEGAGEDSHEGHAHAHGTDPHFWMDPILVAEGALALGEKLTPFDGSEEWMAAARAYADQLTALDMEIREILAVVTPERRKLITGHDAFGYFAQRYGFEVVSTIIPSTHTLAEPGSAHLAELVGLMIEHDIPAIFVDIIDTDSPDLGEALAAEVGSGVRVVELYTGSLGGPGSGAETLISMLRVNAQRIAEALG